MRGRIRSKTRGLRGPRSRVFHCEPGCNAAVGSHPGGSGTGRQAVMAAATPQPSWQASLRGLQAETRHSLLRMWAYKRFGLLLLGLWGLLLLYYYLSPGERPLWGPWARAPQGERRGGEGAELRGGGLCGWCEGPRSLPPPPPSGPTANCCLLISFRKHPLLRKPFPPHFP